MNIRNAKNYLLALGLVLTGGVMAQTTTVNYTGSIKAATCSLTVATAAGSTTPSTGTYTVALPPVGLGAGNGNGLGVSGGIAGKTAFYMGVTNCGTGVALTPSISFFVSSGGRIDGSLNPTVSAGMSNIVIDLLDKTGAKIELAANAVLATFNWPSSGAAASYENQYFLQYRAYNGAATGAGNVTGSFTVALSYL